MTAADVVVVGAGVIGLTTAITLAEAGYRTVVRAAERPEMTTSAVAAATWGPWMVEPSHRVLPWARTTLAALTTLAGQPGTGVRLATGREVGTREHHAPEWTTLLGDRRPCRPDELPPGYSHGVRFTTPLIDMPTYLAYLARRFLQAGGRLRIGRVSRLSDVLREAPTVVCCAGIGARELAGDESVTPVRGQHLVVSNPGLTEFIQVDTGDSPELTAIYPHERHVILAGTAEPSVWSRFPDRFAADGILRRCVALEPRLADVTVLDHRVGLRPTRPQVRLELERRGGGSFIHNYGHGGAGVSLAWGCAENVLRLVALG